MIVSSRTTALAQPHFLRDVFRQRAVIQIAQLPETNEKCGEGHAHGVCHLLDQKLVRRPQNAVSENGDTSGAAIHLSLIHILVVRDDRPLVFRLCYALAYLVAGGRFLSLRKNADIYWIFQNTQNGICRSCRMCVCLERGGKLHAKGLFVLHRRCLLYTSRCV